MANFYTDHPEIKFNLESSPLMQRIVELKENGFADKDNFDYAPEDFADAMDNYNRVLEVAGDITANTVFPNSEDVDAEGPHCENGRVRYASKTYENLEATRKAGLNGVTMPRRFGGLNFPITAYTAINEMIASADGTTAPKQDSKSRTSGRRAKRSRSASAGTVPPTRRRQVHPARRSQKVLAVPSK